MTLGNRARRKDTKINISVPHSIALASWFIGRIGLVKALKMSKQKPNRLGTAKVSSNSNLLKKRTKIAKTSSSLTETLELMVFEIKLSNRKLLSWYQFTRQRTTWCQMILKSQFRWYQWKRTTRNFRDKRKLTATTTIAECKVSMRFNYRQSHPRAHKSLNRLPFSKNLMRQVCQIAGTLVAVRRGWMPMQQVAQPWSEN